MGDKGGKKDKEKSKKQAKSKQTEKAKKEAGGLAEDDSLIRQPAAIAPYADQGSMTGASHHPRPDYLFERCLSCSARQQFIRIHLIGHAPAQLKACANRRGERAKRSGGRAAHWLHQAAYCGATWLLFLAPARSM